MNIYKITTTQINAFNPSTQELVKETTVKAKSAIAALWESGHIAGRYAIDNNKKVENAYTTWADGTKTALAERV